MSSFATALKLGGLLAPFPSSSGLSAEASEVERHINSTCSYLWESLSLRHVSELALFQLFAVALETAKSNWDGHGARPINPAAFEQAQRFLAALPTTTPVPTVNVDPDGEVSVSWDLDRHWTFSASVGPTGRISYAGLFGSRRAYGTEWFFGEIPQPILDGIARVHTNTIAADR